MSSITLDTINGKAKQSLAYAAQWYLNGDISRTSGGDLEFASNSFTLDANYSNVNAAALKNPSTAAFAITFPVQGIWSVKWSHRGSVTLGNASVINHATYISGHILNGTSYSAIGTPASLPQRLSETDNIVSPSANTSFPWSPTIHNMATITEEFKAGDTIAPSFYSGAGTNVSTGTYTKLTVCLIRQTA